MNVRRLRLSGRVVLAALIVGIATTGDGRAQKAPAPPQPNPQAPVLAAPLPLGVQRGTTLDLTLTGSNLAEPTGLWTSFPCKVTVPAENNNGKDNAKLLVRLEVPADAPVGLHTVRLATTRGMSNLRPFCVDDMPQLNEEGGNRAKTTPQALPVPCVVVGRADAEASDYFKITAKAGQRLSFEVLGRRLGSAFDPQLTLMDARGRELIGGHSNDAPGLQTDPRLTYTFKEAGDYLIEVRDSTYRGGPDFHYRLRVGDFPCATAPLPMAARRGNKVSVTFAGPNVEGVAPVEVTVPEDPTVNTVWVAPTFPNGPSGWPVALAVSDLDQAAEQEPNNEPAKANRVAVPGGVTARFEAKGDVDHFVFAAKKGQRYVLEATTLELYSPTEVYLVLKDAKGGQVAVSKPAQAPRLDFTAAADGDYTLTVEHLLHWGGPAETYHLSFAPYRPGFDLTLALERWDVRPGGTVALPILATRRDYTGPIEVSVVGPPGLEGKATIAAGQPAQPGQLATTLQVSAGPDAPSGPYTLVLRGKAKINDQDVTSYVSVRAVVSQALGGLPYPPRTLNEQVAVAVTEKAPFALAVKFDQPESLRGGTVGLTVTATRVAGFTEEIALSAAGLPANVTAALKNIPASQTEAKGELKPAANAAVGSFPITVSGKAKFNGKDFTVPAPPSPLVLVPPFVLKVEPAPVPLEPGGKVKVKVTATRKGGYQGPIALEFRNLPANVTAPKAEIAADETSADVEITAADNAAAGDKADVNILGTAPAAGGQQNPTPNFTVSVKAKK